MTDETHKDGVFLLNSQIIRYEKGPQQSKVVKCTFPMVLFPHITNQRKGKKEGNLKSLKKRGSDWSISLWPSAAFPQLAQAEIWHF